MSSTTRAKSISLKLYDHLIVREEKIMKLQDALMFYNVKNGVLYYVFIHLCFFLWCAINPSVFMLLLLLVMNYKQIKALVSKAARKVFFSSNLLDIPTARYSVSEICAGVGSVAYFIMSFFELIAKSSRERNVAGVVFGFLVMLSILVVCINVPDVLICYTLVISLSLIPLVRRFSDKPML